MGMHLSKFSCFLAGVAFAVLLATPLRVFSEKASRIMETIDTVEITTDAFETYYRTSVELATRVSNADRTTLYKLVCNPDLAPNAQYRDMVQQLQPENSYAQFRDNRMIRILAEKDGLLDRPIISDILEHTRNQTIAQLYLHEKVWERIKITPADTRRKCQELRDLDPQRVGPLSNEDCRKVAEGALKASQYHRALPEVYATLKKRVMIQSGDNFDRARYFAHELPLYQAIKKSGGCAASQE
jgi:hypothetical protein